MRIGISERLQCEITFIIEWARFSRSSSILMTVPRFLGFAVLPLWLAVAPLTVIVRAQDPQEKKDTFFTGTVIESTQEKVTVSRKNLGKTEKRTFRVTPDTKCQGELKVKVQVTVRYVVTDDGETAELIIVRSQQKKTKQ
jgi:hypothetical protein